MKKTIKSHEEKETKQREEVPEGALPAYLLDREKQSRAKILSNTIKQKRKEKAVRKSNRIEIFNNNFCISLVGQMGCADSESESC